MSQEFTIMPKELRDAPATEVLTGCPCCHEALIVSVRIGKDELCVGVQSVNMRDTVQKILAIADKVAGE